MFQLNHAYRDEQGLRAFLDQVSISIERNSTLNLEDKILFHVYVNVADRAVFEPVSEMIRKRYPYASIVGCTTGGNLIDGELPDQGESWSISISCTVFEDEDTRIQVMQLPLDYDTQESSAAEFVRAVDERPWVKAVEMLVTLENVDLIEFCEKISTVRGDIAFFGGATINTEDPKQSIAQPFVSSSAGSPCACSTVFVLYGGANLHVETDAVVGWKLLGLPLEVTRSDRAILHELNGEPAVNAYRHYLQIDGDDNFFESTIAFPLAFGDDETPLLKSALVAHPDGSLSMTSELTKSQRTCRFAYGDPEMILESAQENVRRMRDFNPQVIFTFSCVARLYFWGDEEASCETRPFSALAPSIGFFTGSEFMRRGNDVMQHNVTLVVAGLREGEPIRPAFNDISVGDAEVSGHLKTMRRLTTFIGRISEDLSDAYDKMALMAKTDMLTGLFARWETERILRQAFEETTREADASLAQADDQGNAESPVLLMCDIDNFKQVNDQFGHQEGDRVLRELGRILADIPPQAVPNAESGRWGGEEFMVVLPHAPLDVAVEIAEKIRTVFEQHAFDVSGNQTVSFGVAKAHENDTVDSLCSRVDDALYQAKREGKNRVIVK